MGRAWKNFEAHNRNILDSLKQTVNRSMDITVPAGENSEARRKHGQREPYHLGKHVNGHK